jgi:hypothetical protein
VCVAGAAGLALAARTRARNDDWRTSEALFSAGIFIFYFYFYFFIFFSGPQRRLSEQASARYPSNAKMHCKLAADAHADVC